MAYKSLHTLYGLTQLAKAELTGAPINLTHMAVGDGNGSPTAPAETDTQLQRERFRAPVNRVYQSPDNPARFIAELVLPSTVGGWVLREVGIFDSAGGLFAIGNLPETYKPTVEEGAFADAVVRLEFVVSSASVINLQLDPYVAVASQAWVINNLTAAQIIPGGTVTQVLGKASNADGDYQWQDLGSINVTVDTVAEKQLLAANQRQVDLSRTTTYGLAVYLDGKRLDIGAGVGEWQAHGTIPTRLTLGQSYPGGTRLTLVNNEPAGSAPAPLERGQHLADVIDKAKARANLDIFSKAEARQLAPTGLIGHFARSTAPPGWLKMNGAAISRIAYADLFAVIGTTYGNGDGFSTFNVPEVRGEHIVGWDDGRGVDGGRVLGSWKAGAIQSHSHTGNAVDAGSHSHAGTALSDGSHNHGATSSNAGNHSHGVPKSAGSNNTSGSWVSPANNNNSLAYTNEAGDHSHAISVGSAGTHEHRLSINSAGTHSHNVTIGATGSAETRVRSVAFLACIKF